MSKFPQPEREAQAKREIGTTEIGSLCARVLSIAFLAAIGSVLVLDPVIRRFGSSSTESEMIGSPSTLARELMVTVGDDLRQVRTVGLIATNRMVMKALSSFDYDLEEGSLLRQRLLPPVQWRLAEWLGLGNEMAYLGREGWLFYRPDIDYVIGRGFLNSTVLETRAREGDPWTEPPQPDPMLAISDLRRQLQARGVELLVVPTPVKPTLYPEAFSDRAARTTGPLNNESFNDFLARAAAEGIDTFDPTPVLENSKGQPGKDLFLRTDSHWTPFGLDLVAQALAEAIRSRLSPKDLNGPDSIQRSAILEGFGDIAQMLWVPTDQDLILPDLVEVSMVTNRSGQVWRSDRASKILLLGDSFTNVYSDAGLGWGAGAGLAERISFHLNLPIDKIALNAGGALGSRQALQRALGQDPDRLENKSLVIYQFATRELSLGDWRLVDLGSEP